MVCPHNNFVDDMTTHTTPLFGEVLFSSISLQIFARVSVGIPADITWSRIHIRYFELPYDAFEPQKGSALPLPAAAVALTLDVSGNGC